MLSVALKVEKFYCKIEDKIPWDPQMIVSRINAPPPTYVRADGFVTPKLLGLALICAVLTISLMPVQTATAAGPGDDITSYTSDRRLFPVYEHLIENRFKEALDLLQPLSVEDPDDADIQNLMGFSYRKLQFYDVALKHYEASLAIDPEFKRAIEYLGELYLATDQLSLAEEQYAKLEGLCGFFCREKRLLKKAIKTYKKENAN